MKATARPSAQPAAQSRCQETGQQVTRTLTHYIGHSLLRLLLLLLLSLAHDSSHLLTVGHVGPPLLCNILKLVDVPDMNYLAVNGEGEVHVTGCYHLFVLHSLFFVSQLIAVSGY